MSLAGNISCIWKLHGDIQVKRCKVNLSDLLNFMFYDLMFRHNCLGLISISFPF